MHLLTYYILCWQGKIQIDNAYGWRFVWTWIISQNNEKKCLVLRDLWKTTFEYTLQKFYWLHVIPNSKSVLENHKKFTDVVRFFQFILSCIIMYVPFNFHLFKYIFLQVVLAPPFSHRNLFSSTSFCAKLQKSVGAIRTVSLSYELLTTHVSTKKPTSKFSRIIEPIRLFWRKKK